jgi:NAD-dependent DNA ligase
MSVVVPGSIVLSATNFTNDLVWDTPRGDLIVRNETALKDLGVPQTPARAFMKNAAIPLSVKTDLVQNLEKLGSVKGRAAVVELAATAHSEEQARFLATAVRLLGKRRGLEEMTATGTVVGREQGGAIVVPAPVDYVSWTERVARFANRNDLKAAQRTILLTGKMSPRARQEFEALGWKVEEEAR